MLYYLNGASLDEQFLHFIGGFQRTLGTAGDRQECFEPLHHLGILTQLFDERFSWPVNSTRQLLFFFFIPTLFSQLAKYVHFILTTILSFLHPLLITPKAGAVPQKLLRVGGSSLNVCTAFDFLAACSTLAQSRIR